MIKILICQIRESHCYTGKCRNCPNQAKCHSYNLVGIIGQILDGLIPRKYAV